MIITNGDKKASISFSPVMYGELEQLPNSSFSKTRVRIFYRGGNRNGSYINDDSANRLIASIPGSPIVGHYNIEIDDFTDHNGRETKAYGFVPLDDYNFSWENHTDKDGVTRNYACVDVILWTGRYKEANLIPGKPQSMELNDKTINGEWRIIDGEYYFVITDAEFLGLCVLGTEVEPCFEGAGFFSLNNYGREFYEMMNKYKEEYENGGKQMVVKDKFENDDDVVNANNDLDNVETLDTEGQVEGAAGVAAPASAPVTPEVPPAETTPEVDENEEPVNDPVEEEEGEDTDVPETSEETEPDAEVLETDDQPNFSVEQLTQIATEITNLRAEVKELREFKLNTERRERQSLLDSYSSKLSGTVYEAIKAKLDSFADLTELKKEIAYEILMGEGLEDPVAATEETEEEVTDDLATKFNLVSTNNSNMTGVEALIGKYVK